MNRVPNEYAHIPDYDPDVPSREDILVALREASDPLTIEALADYLGLERESTLVGYERRIRAMLRDGQLYTNRTGVLLLAKKLDFIAGRVLGHRDGFGFLVRDEGGPDIYLSPREMAKVLHGDRVLVKLIGEHRGKPDGIIMEVLERRTVKLVGRFLKEHGVSVVAPEDQRVKHDILVPPTETGGAKHGQVVCVEIIQQPTRQTQPLGRVSEILGEIDDPGMEIEIAVRKFDVPVDFSDAAQAQARDLPDTVQNDELKGRVDLRDVPLITIDGEDARDFDDAVYCEPVELGTEKRKRPGWRLIVAIADVSHYVREGQPLDVDARARGTSVYFPRRVIPMLPAKLSTGICSLNPNVERLTLVCDMVIAGNGVKAGQVVAYQFYPAVIKSHARTTYTQVWEALQQPKGPVANELGTLLGPVQHLYALSLLLIAARKKRGAIDFETVETKIVCDDLGRIDSIIGVVRNDAHRMIEESMLAANTCAADFMQRSRHAGLYRIHEGPTTEKLQSLRLFLKTLGLELEGGAEPSASDYAKLVDKVRDRPDFDLLQTMCLRSMQQAIYSPDNMGHFGLSYTAYSHFTSPIRRYPDLLTHRVIKALLRKQRYTPTPPDHVVVPGMTAQEIEHDIWQKLGVILSAYERRADDASRDVEAWLKCWFAKEKIGEVFSGRITGVANFGIFVTLDTLHVEGMVHVSELGTEYFQFNEAMHELRGERTGQRYRLTDTVQVQIANVDLEARRIEFRLVTGTSYAALKRVARRMQDPSDDVPVYKKPAAPKPSQLKGKASERRAKATREARKAIKASSKASSKAKSKSSAGGSKKKRG
ncbi:ribonuclease R [Orrella sp. 11846]|uniref:ribonuclease R n=1 Tax=Orrella sp. 11846 TaxID=3409913 RepID=UPI003B5A4E0B